jgi:hypothetical protein
MCVVLWSHPSTIDLTIAGYAQSVEMPQMYVYHVQHKYRMGYLSLQYCQNSFSKIGVGGELDVWHVPLFCYEKNARPLLSFDNVFNILDLIFVLRLNI